jgi:hypothetical protein
MSGTAARLCLISFLVFAIAGPSAAQQGEDKSLGQVASDTLVPTEVADKWGYADREGHIVIAPQFVQARSYSEGLAAVYVETEPASKVGFVDQRGTQPAKQAVRKWGFIDSHGQLVVPAVYEGVGIFSEGLAAVTYEIPSSDEDTWGYIDTTGKIVVKPQFSLAHPFSEGLAMVQSGGKRIFDPGIKDFVTMGYIDHNGRWAFRSEFLYYFYDSFSEGLVPFRKNFGKWEYKDKTGKTVIEPRFDWGGSFVQGVAPIVSAGKCGHIDKSGKLMPELQNTSEPQAKYARDKHGIYLFKPTEPPCS